MEGERIRLLARGRFARAVAWKKDAVYKYMQGSSSVEERLRLRFTPILDWKARPDGGIKGILLGWEREVCIWQKEWGWETYLWRYKYEKPLNQPAEVSLDTWLDNHYQEEYPYLDHDVWEWGTALVRGRSRVPPTVDEPAGFAFQLN